MMHETILYDTFSNEKVRCNICQRRCIIDAGKIGYCRTRINKKGKLYSLVYARVSSIAISPIEKKPVFHFYPASKWLSLGSLGCNFRCLGCQNWDIAHSKVDESELKSTDYVSPEDCIHLARRHNCLGISWTYNEPTLWFEYTLETAKLAKQNDFYTNYVTNGFITQEALDLIGPFLDIFRVDIKGSSDEFYKKIANVSNFKGILEVTEQAKKKWNMHVEVVTNIIPGYNDDERGLKNIASWICSRLSEDTPWHVTQFIPHLKLSYINPTPVSILEKAREIGFREGLRYVYIGNIPGHPGEDTYCYKCKSLLIKRDGFSVLENRIKVSKCPDCSAYIAGRFD